MTMFTNFLFLSFKFRFQESFTTASKCRKVFLRCKKNNPYIEKNHSYNMGPRSIFYWVFDTVFEGQLLPNHFFWAHRPIYKV